MLETLLLALYGAVTDTDYVLIIAFNLNSSD